MVALKDSPSDPVNRSLYGVPDFWHKKDRKFRRLLQKKIKRKVRVIARSYTTHNKLRIL